MEIIAGGTSLSNFKTDVKIFFSELPIDSYLFKS